VSQGVRADALGREERLLRCRSDDVSFEDRDHAEARDPLAVRIQEEWRIRLVPVITLLEIHPKCIHGLLPEWARTFLPPFAENAYLGGRFEAYILDVQGHGFGSPCTGVVKEGKQSSVSTTETVRR
jgi:hypothetical protein